jgi:hypothetical protein
VEIRPRTRVVGVFPDGQWALAGRFKGAVSRTSPLGTAHGVWTDTMIKLLHFCMATLCVLLSSGVTLGGL